MKQKFFVNATWAMALALGLKLSLGLPAALAVDVCDGNTVEELKKQGGYVGQSAAHCQQAEDAEKTANYQMMGGIGHMAAAATCGIACAQGDQLNQALAKACTIGSLGAAAADVATTMMANDSMMNAVGGLMPAAMQAMRMKSVFGAADKFKESASEHSQAACMSALFEGMTGAMKFAQMQQSKNNAKHSRGVAQQLKNNSFNSPTVAGAAGAVAPTSGGGPGLQSIVNSSNIDKGNKVDCFSGEGSGSAKMACAIAQDNSLPPWVADGTMEKVWADRGVDLGKFLSSANGAGSGAQVFGAAASALGLEAGEAVAAIDQLQGYIGEHPDEFGGSYSSGGSRKIAQDSGRGEAMADALKGLMDKFGLNGKDGKKAPEQNEIEFKLAKMQAKEIMEDRSISLFDRVGFRYKKSISRVHQSPWLGRYNQHANRLPAGATQ